MENHPKTKPATSVEVKRARRVAIVLASLTCLAIMFFMYGHVQKMNADRNLVLANQYKIEAEVQRKIASETHAESVVVKDQLAEAVMALQKCKENQK